MGLIVQSSYLFKPFVDVTLEMCECYLQLLGMGLLVLQLFLTFLQLVLQILDLELVVNLPLAGSVLGFD